MQNHHNSVDAVMVVGGGKKVETIMKDENSIRMIGLEHMLNATVADGHYLVDKNSCDSIFTTDIDAQMLAIEYFKHNNNRNRYYISRCYTNQRVIEILENTTLIVSVSYWTLLLLCEIGIFIPVSIDEILLLVTHVCKQCRW